MAIFLMCLYQNTIFLSDIVLNSLTWSGKDLSLLINVVIPYISCSEDTVIHTKQMTLLPNEKWVNEEKEICLVLKKQSFL